MNKVYIREIPRDSRTGRICTKDFALKHPNITTIEHRKITIRKK